MNYKLEHCRTQIALLEFSKTFRSAVLGQNIMAFYIISTNQICCLQTMPMSFLFLKTAQGKVSYELSSSTCGLGGHFPECRPLVRIIPWLFSYYLSSAKLGTETTIFTIIEHDLTSERVNCMYLMA